MTVRFQRRTVLPATPDVVYSRSLDVDFHQTSFAHSNERSIGGVRHGEMRLGDIVTWRARHLGRWWEMTTIISHADPPHRFVDEQHHGPFASFVHEHTFQPLGGDWTEMRDHVEFAAPLGVLGRIAEATVLRWYLPRLIDIRNAALAAEFSTLDRPT